MGSLVSALRTSGSMDHARPRPEGVHFSDIAIRQLVLMGPGGGDAITIRADTDEVSEALRRLEDMLMRIGTTMTSSTPMDTSLSFVSRRLMPSELLPDTARVKFLVSEEDY